MNKKFNCTQITILKKINVENKLIRSHATYTSKLINISMLCIFQLIVR